MEIMTNFEKRVRKALIDKDMTASSLATELGVSPAYICDILKGNRSAPKVRQQICELLEIGGEVNESNDRKTDG